MNEIDNITAPDQHERPDDVVISAYLEKKGNIEKRNKDSFFFFLLIIISIVIVFFIGQLYSNYNFNKIPAQSHGNNIGVDETNSKQLQIQKEEKKLKNIEVKKVNKKESVIKENKEKDNNGQNSNTESKEKSRKTITVNININLF
ncbi:hypothetical protein ACTA71_009235 [Dictyostelium dimigraforme]